MIIFEKVLISLACVAIVASKSVEIVEILHENEIEHSKPIPKKKVEFLGVPVKSPSDKKDYRAIKLENGLKALLIHNPKNDEKAAAKMLVNVGFYDDPDHVAGLAHFLEHLMFKGNKKYPIESHSNKFFESNGGHENAYTTEQTTNYYFSVQEHKFVEALDIFSSMFVGPLLRKTSMQREREAVDSEYLETSTEDDNIICRIYERQTVDPFRKFGGGNLKSLKENITDDDLHREILEFYSKHYVANRMYLTLESHQSLDDLENLVIEKFSAIKSGEVPKNNYPSYDKAFKEEFFSKIIYYKPIVDKKSLVMTWVLPPYHLNCRKDLTEYFGDELFVSSNYEGGLAKYLKERGLINSLSYQRDEQANDAFQKFQVIFSVVDHFNSEDIERILEASFSYLMTLKETPIEEHRQKFAERQKRKKIDFKFEEVSKFLPSDDPNDRDLSENFRLCKIDDVLARDSIVEFDEQVFREIMNILTSDKFNVMIIDPEHKEFNQKEETFNQVYDLVDRPESWKELWNQKTSTSEFHFNKLNPFIAENFEIFIDQKESSKYPEKMSDSDLHELWHKLDDNFCSGARC